MSNYSSNSISYADSSNEVLSNTYKFLSYTLGFSGVCALLGMFFNISLITSGMSTFVFFIGYFALLYFIEKNKNNSMGVYLTFAFTGVMGLTLSPLLNAYMNAGQGGIIATSLLGTGGVFYATSLIGKSTRKDLSSYAKLVFPVMIMGFVAGLVNAFVFGSSMFAIAISSLFLVCSSFVIAWQTQQIINGGERNYISATVTLYVSIYNIFTSLLHILGAASRE